MSANELLPGIHVCCAMRSSERIAPCLSALDKALEKAGSLRGLYCLAPQQFASQLAPFLAAWPMARHVAVPDGDDWHVVANGLLSSLDSNDGAEHLFFLDSDVDLLPDSLAQLQDVLCRESSVCGATPLLLTPPFASGRQRVLHAGTVADCRQQIYHLYEGLPAEHSLLSSKIRFFQTAPEAALLVRLRDVRETGGFPAGLDELTGLGMGLGLGKRTGGQFACVSQATAVWHDVDASWKICGLWNSLAQRGRFAPGTVQDDYADIVGADKMALTVNEWLTLGTQDAQIDTPAGENSAESTWENAWLTSRHHNPVAMLQYLQATPPERLPRLLALCRSLPALHPHAFAWYDAQSRALLQWARQKALPELEAQVIQWQKRARRFHHSLLKPIMRALVSSGFYNVSLDSLPAQYDAWLELEEVNQRTDLGRVDVGRAWPEIAVIVPVYNPEPRFLREALDSILAQRYPRWQLCVADDASTNAAIPALLREYAARDERIRLVVREQNGHISRASNSALELADAPFAAFFDHDDLLHPDALACVAEHLANNPATRFVYTDEDKVDTENIRRTPIFKPDFDMDLHYTWHLSTYSSDLLRQLGALRPGLEGSQDFDLSLRVTERLATNEIAHISRVLYHWRIHEKSTTAQLGAKPYVLNATQRALADSCHRRHLPAEIRSTGKNNFFRPLFQTSTNCQLNLVLLADSPSPMHASMRTFCEQCTGLGHVSLSWLPLGAWDCPESDRRFLEVLPNAQFTMAGACHWIEQCNHTLLHPNISSDKTLFCTTSLIPEDGMCASTQMLTLVSRPDIALVGGELWHDQQLLFGGWYPDVTGRAFSLSRGINRTMLQHVSFGQLLLNRRVLAPAWQCVAVKTADFQELGGLDARFGEWAWVDYALRAETAGKGHCLLTPWAQWQVPAGVTAPAGDIDPSLALARLRERWGDVIARHGTRNQLLCAAPDNGWALRFSGSQR